MINIGILKEQLKRYWGISALSFLAYVLVVYRDLLYAGRWVAEGFVFFLILTITYEYMLIILMLSTLAAAYFTMGFMSDAKATTFLYSLPISRKQLFATNALAGILIALIPAFLFCLLLVATRIDAQFVYEGRYIHTLRPYIESYRFMHVELAGLRIYEDTHKIYNMANAVVRLRFVVGLFARMTLVIMYYFAMFWLAISLTGRKIPALLMAVAFPFVSFVAANFIYSISWAYLFGFNPQTLRHFVSDISLLTNPIVLGGWLASPFWQNSMFFSEDRHFAVLIAGYIILGLAMFAAAFAVSGRRKAERVGDYIMFAPVRSVLVFLASVAIPLALFLSESDPFIFLITAPLFPIGYFVAWMIFDKTFRVWHRVKSLPYYFGAAAGLYALILFVTQIGMGFYVNRVPLAEDTQWVSFEQFSHHRQLGFGFISPVIQVDDTELIEQIREAHQEILDGRIGRWWRGGYEIIYITYRLNNGQLVRRIYYVPPSFLSREELIILRAPILRERGSIDEIAIYLEGEDYTTQIYITDSNHINMLMDIITESVVADYRGHVGGELPTRTNPLSSYIFFRDNSPDAQHSERSVRLFNSAFARHIVNSIERLP